MGRVSDARERLMAAALELFSQRSYSSVGVAEIAAKAGVQKGSFYYFFPSKEELALAVIDEHWAWQRGLWQGILDGDGTTLQRLRGIFDAMAKLQSDALNGIGSVTGCLFGSLALEAGAISDEVRSRLQQIFDEQVAMIEERLAAAVDLGELTVADPHAAAKSLVAQLEGLILLAKLFNDPTQLDSMWASTLQLLGASALSH